MRRSAFLRIVLPLLLIALAVVVVALFVLTRPQPQKGEETVGGALVRTVTARYCEVRPHVTAKGAVQARQRVAVHPQVSGEVVDVAPQLEPGGVFHKGEKILQINRKDYQLSLEMERSRLLEARANLEEAQAQHQVSKEELRLYRDGEAVDEESLPLVLDIPQLAAAQAAVDAAEAAIKQAKLNLDRTQVTAPFNGVVTQASADVGQLVSRSTRIAELVGVDAFDVIASRSTDQLSHITAGPRQGSLATVSYDAGGQTRRLTGRVIQKLPSVDPAGRMAQLLVRVADPLSLQSDDRQQAGQASAGAQPPPGEELVPLLLSSYVDLEIRAEQSVEAVVLPREYLHRNNQVYLYRNGELRIADVDVVWRQAETLLVQGLAEGDQIITTRLAAPVDGLAVRLDARANRRATACEAAGGGHAQPTEQGASDAVNTAGQPAAAGDV